MIVRCGLYKGDYLWEGANMFVGYLVAAVIGGLTVVLSLLLYRLLQPEPGEPAGSRDTEP